jgi:hypothetical protein
MLAACATTSGGGKSSSGAFQGEPVVQKRQAEINEAAKSIQDCTRVKAGETPAKGGVFAVVADSSGKLTVSALKWDGPDAMKQCIVDKGSQATVTPLAGPPVGTVWDLGAESSVGKPPEDYKVKMQPLAETMQSEVKACGDRILGVDFGATIEVAYYIYSGQAYAPTVMSSDAKDGSFENCVRDVVMKTKFPAVAADKPFPSTSRFKIGVYGETQRVQ